MSLAQLESSLKTGLAPVYVVVGDAEPLVASAVERIRAQAEPLLGPVAFNLTVVRASEPEAEEAFRTARTLPMMGSKRLVIVREVEAGSAAFFEAALAYIEASVEEAVVVLQGAKFPTVTKGSKDWGQQLKRALKGKGGVFLKLSAKDVRADQFARERAQSLGKTLAAANARLLVEVVGDDLARLGQEVEKLALYVGDQAEITSDDIHAATALLAQAVIWDLTGAIASGNADLAIESLHRLQEGGDDPRRLLSMIAWQARDLCRMHARVRAGLSDGQIRAQVRMQPDAFRHAKARMVAGTFPHSAKVMGRLSDANRAMNSHRAGAARIIEELVLDLVLNK